MPIAELLAEVVAEGAIAVGTEVVQRASLADDAKRLAAWRELAERLGAAWQPPEGGALPSFYGGFDVTRGDSIGRVEAHIRRTGGHTGAYTVARSPYVLGAGPALNVIREGIMESLRKWLGAEDVAVGRNEAFDRRFIVRGGGDSEGTSEALSADVQTRLLAHHDDAVLSSDGKIVTVAWRGFEKDTAKVESALEVVLGVAQCRVGWFEAVGETPGARRIGAAGSLEDRAPPSFAFDDGPAPVRVFPALVNTRLALRAHARRARPSPVSLRLAIEKDGSFDRTGVPDGLVSSSVASRLGELGGARIGAEQGEVWIDLDGTPSATRMGVAVWLVGAMAAGVEGSAFR